MTNHVEPQEAIRNRNGDVVYTSFQERPKPDFTLDLFHKILLCVSIAVTIILPIYFAIRALGVDGPLPMQYSFSGEVTREGSAGEAVASLVFLALVTVATAVLGRFPQIFNFPFMLTEHNVQRQYKNAVQMMVWLTASITLILVFMVASWLGPIGGGWALLPVGLMLLTVGIFIWRMFKLR